MNQAWSQQGNNFIQTETTNQIKDLPKGLYKTQFSDKIGVYLECIGDEFKFPYKVYGTHQPFIDWTLKTLEHTEGNIGILMNGVKGTGKSVTLQQLANAIAKPVIIVTQNIPGLIDFLANFQQEVVVVFDEFEKIFIEDGKRSDTAALLTIMDGVLKTDFRKIFICTTNEIRMNDNLLQRPGRLRYIKTFGNLTPEQIAEIVDDKLVHKEMRDIVIKQIATLQLITVDIVCAVINEVNIHACEPKVFFPFFNIKINNPVYDVYRQLISNGVPQKEELYKSGVTGFDGRLPEVLSVGSYFYVNHTYMGEVEELLTEDKLNLKVSLTSYAKDAEGRETDEEIETVYQYRIDPVDTVNNAYKGYAF